MIRKPHTPTDPNGKTRERKTALDLQSKIGIPARIQIQKALSGTKLKLRKKSAVT